ncbi:MAG: hypothetical protein RLZZ574_2924 [Cyanobacteriota bacterium]|jgi:hypothetical protein
MTDKNLFLESPETILDIEGKSYDAVWAVVGSNSRVVKNWRELILSCPENAIRCYQHLSQNPMQRTRGRIFPLRGKKFKGAWEYEITGADRVFYVPLPDEKKVVVYYAGKHPVKNKYPQPPNV